MLTINDVTLSRSRKIVLSDFSAGACKGSIIALLGPNGTGKTTLLHYLSGLLKADTGAVMYGEEKVNPEGTEWKRKISYILDNGGIIPLLTVEEQINLQCDLSGLGRTESAKRSEHVLSLLGLERFRTFRADELSLGTQKRLGIALGIIRDAEVFLFDEPLNSLDEEGYAVFGGILTALRKGGRISIVASHSLPFIYPLSDSIWYLTHEGHTVYTDKEVFKSTESAGAKEIILPWII